MLKKCENDVFFAVNDYICRLQSLSYDVFASITPVLRASTRRRKRMTAMGEEALLTDHNKLNITDLY